MSEVARYFNLNFCNPSFNSRYKSLLIWYLPDIWTTYNEIHLCLYYVWIMNTITTWPQQTLLICSPKNHYNVNKQTISWCQLLLWDIHVTCALTAHHIHCYYVKKDSKEIRLLHRHWYIQYIPIESNFLKKNLMKKVILWKRFSLITKVWNFLLDSILLLTF